MMAKSSRLTPLCVSLNESNPVKPSTAMSDDPTRPSDIRDISILRQNSVDVDNLYRFCYLEELLISETSLGSMRALGRIQSLRRLYLYSNKISSYRGICGLTRLEVLWLSDNGLKDIDEVQCLPLSLKELCLARNPIWRIGDGLLKLTNIQSLNLSGTEIYSLGELRKLSALPSLEVLSFVDPMWGDSPVAKNYNYATIAIYHLKQLKVLDGVTISDGKRLREGDIMEEKKAYYELEIKRLKKEFHRLKNQALKNKQEYSSYREQAYKALLKLYMSEKEEAGFSMQHSEADDLDAHLNRKRLSQMSNCLQKLKAKIHRDNLDFSLSLLRERSKLEEEIKSLRAEFVSAGNIKIRRCSKEDKEWDDCCEVLNDMNVDIAENNLVVRGVRLIMCRQQILRSRESSESLRYVLVDMDGGPGSIGAWDLILEETNNRYVCVCRDLSSTKRKPSNDWDVQGQFRVCIAETSRVDVQDLEKVEAREVSIRYIVDYSCGYNLRAENNSIENRARELEDWIKFNPASQSSCPILKESLTFVSIEQTDDSESKTQQTDFQTGVTATSTALSLHNRDLCNLEVYVLFGVQGVINVGMTIISTLFELGNLTKLERLDCSHNRISSTSGLENLVNLTELDFEWNQLTSIEEVFRLRKLRLVKINLLANPVGELAEYRTAVRFALPSVSFIDEIKVVELDSSSEECSQKLSLFCDMCTENIDAEFLTGCTVLDISHCTVIALCHLQRFPNLRSIDLEGNLIEKLDGIAGLTALERLSVAHNKIKIFPENLEWTNLSYLSVDSNDIRDLSPLIKCKKLKELHAADNKIERDIVSSITSPKEISVLDFRGNPVAQDPLHRLAAIFHFSQLKVLDGNPVLSSEKEEARKCVKGSPAHFINPETSNCSLLELDLSDQNLRDFAPTITVSLSRLRILKLNNNSFREVPSTIGDMAHLVHLSMEQNLLSDSCMDSLHLSSARPPLRVLSIGGNRISSIEKLGLQYFPRLEILFLNDNYISGFSDGLVSLCNLTELVLDRNFIRCLHPYHFRNQTRSLVELRLDHNLVEDFGFIQELKSLKSLHLSQNRLFHVALLESLRPVTTLIDLTLSRNQLCRQRLYRELALSICPSLRYIDSTPISQTERQKAESLLTNAHTSHHLKNPL